MCEWLFVLDLREIDNLTRKIKRLPRANAPMMVAVLAAALLFLVESEITPNEGFSKTVPSPPKEVDVRRFIWVFETTEPKSVDLEMRCVET